MATTTVTDVCTHEPGSTRTTQTVDVAAKHLPGVAEIFRALADEARVRIAYALSQAELCVCDLAELCGMSAPAVSHHLRTLRQLRLVKTRREGRYTYYSLDDQHVVSLIAMAVEHVQEEERPHVDE